MIDDDAQLIEVISSPYSTCVSFILDDLSFCISLEIHHNVLHPVFPSLQYICFFVVLFRGFHIYIDVYLKREI